MANGWGGARPGSGRKSRDTIAYEGRLRDLFKAHVTEEAFGQVILSALRDAQQGDARARDWISGYVVGPAPTVTTLNVTQDTGEQPLTAMSDDELRAWAVLRPDEEADQPALVAV